MDHETLIQESQAICAALSSQDDALKRDILGHAGNRWSLSVVHLLGVQGTLRHSEITRQVQGVTQRMLTRTLRWLERDGLIERRDLATRRPHVEYSLTALGQGLLVHMFPLWRWTLQHAEEFREARGNFDRLHLP